LRSLCLPSVFPVVAARLPSSTLFPYTTLFRSEDDPRQPGMQHRARAHGAGLERHEQFAAVEAVVAERRRPGAQRIHLRMRARVRSEEHTSEIQSRENLVCRLLLEKKKN